MTAARPNRSGPKAGGVSPRRLRDLHLYVGVFFAPTIIFFALSGVLQVLGLHEAKGDSGYRPAAVVQKLSEVHIHQRYALPRKPPPRPPSGEAPTAAGPAEPKGPSLGTDLVKWFFAAAASGLIVSSLLGLWIALTQSRQRRLAWLLLGAGAVLPVLMLAL